MRQVVVASQQAGEDWEATEGRVGRQGKDQRDGQRHDVVRPVAPDRVDHDLAQYGLPGTRLHMELVGEEGQAEQHHSQDGAEQQLGPLGPDHAGFTEERDAVGDGFDTGQCAAAGRERLEDQQHADRLHCVGGDQGFPRLGGSQAERVDHADGNDREQPHDEDHGGQQKDPSTLAEAAEIEHGDDQEDAQAHRNRVAGSGGKGRGELSHPGGDGDSHRQCVVDDQRGSGELAGAGTEVVPADRVGPATVGVGIDDLAVGDHEEH